MTPSLACLLALVLSPSPSPSSHRLIRCPLAARPPIPPPFAHHYPPQHRQVDVPRRPRRVAAASDNDAPVHQVLRGSGRRLNNDKGISWCQDDENVVVPTDGGLPIYSCTGAGDETSCVWESTPCKGDCFESSCSCEDTGDGDSVWWCRVPGCEFIPGGEPEAEREKCPDPPTPAPAGDA